jgi:hypothetical protein
MKHRVLLIIGSLSLVCLLGGCSAAMHGYTQRQALDRYLLVDKTTESFGYKRVTYIQGFRPPMKGFIENKGLPDFIYEFKNNEGREGVNLYYVEKNKVYIFVTRDWRPDSIYLKDDRGLNEYELATYKHLKEGRQK